MKKILSLLTVSVLSTSIPTPLLANAPLVRTKRADNKQEGWFIQKQATDKIINKNDIINIIIKLLNISDDNYLEILNSDQTQKIINNSLKLDFFFKLFSRNI